jgi:elongation factor Ts
MDTNLVKQLREATSASIMECDNALKEAGGDLAKATEILKRKGQSSANKRSGRETKAGIIEAYIHPNAKVGVLLDLRCETDFVEKNSLFKELAHELCLQIAAMNPEFVNEENVSVDVVEKDRAIYKEELKDSKKPANIIEQIVEGKIKKRLSESCLMSQPYIKNQDQTVSELLKEYIAKIGENIKVERFVRFEI